MSKAILEFDLPEERDEFTMATKGHQYWSCLWDISQELRRLRKYEELPEDKAEIVDQIEQFFYDRIGDMLEEVA